MNAEVVSYHHSWMVSIGSDLDNQLRGDGKLTPSSIHYQCHRSVPGGAQQLLYLCAPFPNSKTKYCAWRHHPCAKAAKCWLCVTWLADYFDARRVIGTGSDHSVKNVHSVMGKCIYLVAQCC